MIGRIASIFRTARWANEVRRSPFFDADWYLSRNPDVAGSGADPASHYARFGWREGRDPGPAFEGAPYALRYPDVRATGLPPLVHFERFGRADGRAATRALEPVSISVDALEVAAEDATSAIEMSVVMPTFNRASLLPAVLDAWRRVAASTRLRWELIVSDDGSTDGTPQLVEGVKDLPVHLIRNRHGGAGAARNAGIARAVGRRTLIVGDDMFPAPDLLDRHWTMGERLGPGVATLGSVRWHPALVVNHLMLHVTEIGNEQFSYNRLEDGKPTDFRHFYTCNVCVPSHWLRRMRPLFDTEFVGAAFEDTELGYRLSRAGMQLVFDREASMSHHHPYDPAGFCRRQVFAGKMATILARKHPELSWIVLPSRRRLAKRRQTGEWQHRRDQLIRLAEAAEGAIAELDAQQASSIRHLLSALYLKLFKAMYEQGVADGLGEPHGLADAMHRHFSGVGEDTWKALERQMGVDPSGGQMPSSEVQILLRAACAAQYGAAESAARFRNRLHALATECRHDLAGFLVRFPTRLNRLLHRQGALTRMHIIRDAELRSSANRIALSIGLVLDTEGNDPAPIVAGFRDAFGTSLRVLPVTGMGSALRGSDANGLGELPAVIFHPASAASVRCPDRLVSLYLLAAQIGDGRIAASDCLDDARCLVPGHLRDDQALAGSARVGISDHPKEGGPPAWFLRFPTDAPQEPARAVTPAVCATAERHAPPQSRMSVAEWPDTFRTQGKPLILVLPAMMAVGGVERITIEVVRSLADRFSFLIVPTERIRMEQGNLSQRAREAGARVIEIGEIAPPSMHLAMLAEVKRATRPDIVWICNGSPWISRNSGHLRALFADTPMLDQRAYDGHAGWISDYSDPDCRMFDGYVAVNSRIERRMIEHFGLPAGRIRRIYSTVNAAAIREGISRWTQSSARERLGLPAQGHVISFVGRLAPQKQPMRFLQLAANRRGFADETFVMVGDGAMGGEVSDFIAANALGNVRRFPFLSDMMCLHAASSGIIFVSAYEGLPVAMIEANCMSVPCLSTDVGDIGDVLARFGGGITVPADVSVEELVRAFERWKVQLPEFRNALLQHREDLLREFASDRVAAQFEAFWRDLLRRQDSGAASEGTAGGPSGA